MFALVRVGRRFSRMIVARQRKYATVRRGTCSHGVLEDIAGSVNARALAVPHGKHAVVGRTRKKIDLLRAPDRGGRQVFIEAGMKAHVMRLEMFSGLGCGLIHAAQRRAAIAGDKTCGIETSGKIALTLHHRQTNQRLRASQKNTAAFQRVFVIQ